MKRRFLGGGAALFVVLSVCLRPLAAGAKGSGTQPVISRITIRNNDIFDLQSNPKLNHFPYTTINWLHVRTRALVIRDELLFKEGDRVDPFLLRETERNLRALSFIRAARINRFPQRDGTVALVVNTQDAWTTEPMLNLGGVNTVDEVEVGFREKNFLGFGKTVEVRYTSGPDFIDRVYRYFDPQVWHSRLQFEGVLKNNEGGNSRFLTLTRPFFSATTPWAFRLASNHQEDILEQFENNVKVSEFKQTKDINEIFIGKKVAGGKTFVTHAGPRYKRQVNHFSRIPETPQARSLPKTEHFQTIFLDLDARENDFVELTRIEKMTRVEDINLGASFFLSPGISPKRLTGRRNVTELEGVYEQNHLMKQNHLWFTKLRYTGRRLFDTPENQLYELNSRFYYRPSEKQTFVTNFLFKLGENLDSDNLLKLGGDSGLRAYKRDEYKGTRLLLINLEDRFYFIDDAFNLISVGAATFFDAGYAWPRGSGTSLGDIRTDVGVGLRFGLTRSSNEVIIRIDLAYRMKKERSDDSEFVVTFGSGQPF